MKLELAGPCLLRARWAIPQGPRLSREKSKLMRKEREREKRERRERERERDCRIVDKTLFCSKS